MEPRVVWTPAARSDLIDIGYYIGVTSGRPLTADRILDEIHDHCQTCAGFPEVGQVYPELNGNRGFVHKRWLIVYRPILEGIEILAILDSATDYSKTFQSRLK